MGLKYFYNFILSGIDDTDLGGDILSAVRKNYFFEFDKIRDRITLDSEGTCLFYDYDLEKDKPLRWTVKNDKGETLQAVQPSDGGRYYLCFFKDQSVFKRLLFSKLHTLLKAEYLEPDGAVRASLEPRKIQGGLCLLYTDSALTEPLVLTAAPEVNDERIAVKIRDSFSDYSAVASTNEGVLLFLTDSQTAAFKRFVDAAEAELTDAEEVSFLDGEAALFEKINAKDFNVKRNLSASLDISMARSFGAEKPGEETDEITGETAEKPGEGAAEVSEETAEALEYVAVEDTADEEVKSDAHAKPDKLIMADGAVYSYYGDLDGSGNRSGYGRTLTELGRTAYEGTYYNDKRSGKGAYFYKDGTLCYSGDWAENARHGVGVGISSRDGSIHAGRWSNNKPDGNGVRLTAEGDIRFVCKVLTDGTTVLMNYMSDDTVVIARYDSEGSKISEKSVSLTDF